MENEREVLLEVNHLNVTYGSGKKAYEAVQDASALSASALATVRRISVHSIMLSPFILHPRPLRHCLRNATSPKVGGFGSPCKVCGFAKGSPFGRAGREAA